MSRRRPDHSTDMTARSDRNRLRSRRKRRRLARGGIKGLFWLLVMCGVFVLGIGYGRTIGGDESAVGDKVRIDREVATVEATLPTRTVTVTTPKAGTAKTPAAAPTTKAR